LHENTSLSSYEVPTKYDWIVVSSFYIVSILLDAT